MSSESLLKSYHTLWNILWNDLRWKFPITFHLQNNFIFMFSSTGNISMTMVHPMKNTFLSLLSSQEDLPVIHVPIFPNFFCIPSLTSALFCHPLPHCSFNIFNFKFVMVTDYNEVLSIRHTYTEQKANFQTSHLSVSITVSVPYLWSAQLSYSLHPRFQFYEVKLAPAQE